MKASDKKGMVEQILKIKEYCEELDKAEYGDPNMADKAIEALEDYAKGIWLDLLPALSVRELDRLSWLCFDDEPKIEDASCECSTGDKTIRVEVRA